MSERNTIVGASAELSQAWHDFIDVLLIKPIILPLLTRLNRFLASKEAE